MGQVSLAQLREKVRQRLKRGQFTTSSSATLAEVNDHINEGRKAFQAMLAECYGDNYYQKRVEIPTVASESAIDLPDDFYKLKKVYWLRTPGDPPDVPEIHRASVDALRVVEWVRPWTTQYPGYTLAEDQLVFGPTPSDVYTVIVWYVHEGEDLVDADPEAEPPVVANTMYVGPGWSDWIVLEACIRIAGESEKRDSDFARFTAAQARVEARLRAQAPDRNETSAMRMRDVRGGRGMGDQELRDAITVDPRYFR